MLAGRNRAACIQRTVCRVLTIFVPTIGAAWLALQMSSLDAHAQSPDALGVLPRDLTPIGMFMSADIIVKAVMIGLLFASVLTWTIFLAKAYELWFARQNLARAQGSLAAARSFAEAPRREHGKSARRHADRGAEPNFGARRTSTMLTESRNESRLGFDRIEAGVGRQMMRATGILATIGATAPFVGLVRRGLGHHEQLYRDRKAAHHESRRRRPRDRRSAAGDRHRACRRHSGGRDL